MSRRESEMERAAGMASLNATVRALARQYAAALRAVGVEALKMHDVGSLLRAHRRNFPDRFRQQIGKLAAISAENDDGALEAYRKVLEREPRSPGPLQHRADLQRTWRRRRRRTN